jgi:aromatic ring-opening dioxygenase LigB subunit
MTPCKPQINNRMLVFAGFVPTSPLLMPGVNTTRITEAEETIRALHELADELYAAHPDVIVLLADSPTMYPDAFCVNVADPYSADLSAVGDLDYHKQYHPDFGFIDGLQRFARKNSIPVSLATDDKLAFSSAVPLHYLTSHLKDVRIVPIAPSSLDGKAHFAFGNTLQHMIMQSDKRVAVIAAGDMGHAEDAGDFDEKLVTFLKERNSSGLLQVNPDDITKAQDTSYRQICLLFGALDGVNTTPELLSYAKPFGVGYAVVNFVL